MRTIAVELPGGEVPVHDGSLILWNSAGTGSIRIKIPEILEGVHLEYELPSAPPPSGQTDLLAINALGQIERHAPTFYINSLSSVTINSPFNNTEVQDAINSVVTRVNILLARLKMRHIVFDNLTITCPAASCVLGAVGPHTLTPDFAKAVVSTFKEVIPSVGLETAGPV